MQPGVTTWAGRGAQSSPSGRLKQINPIACGLKKHGRTEQSVQTDGHPLPSIAVNLMDQIKEIIVGNKLNEFFSLGFF